MREHSVGSELQAACAQLDIKSLVTKISSIKHVLEFYKSIKTEIVCVCVLFWLPVTKFLKLQQHPEHIWLHHNTHQKLHTAEWDRAGVFVV